MLLVLFLPLLASAGVVGPMGGPYKICLNMIVKDESHVIGRALQSALPWVHAAVISDTGSTDNTIEVIKSYNTSDIPVVVEQDAWVDFATNRNKALCHAKRYDCSVAVILDADDVMVFDGDFRWPGYYDMTKCSMVEVVHHTIRHRRPAVIRLTQDPSCDDVGWHGVLHEYYDCTEWTRPKDLKGVHIRVIGGGARHKDPEKYAKDAALLEKVLGEHPDDTRAMFYLAQSYRDAQQLDKALAAYQRRAAAATHGNLEEVYLSLYAIAYYGQYSSGEEAREAFLRAHRQDPTRHEPLYYVARRHRVDGQFFYCYLMTRYALNIKPRRDAQFFEPWISDWGLNDELAVCAYNVGKYDESRAASEAALQFPLEPHVETRVRQNLAAARQKLGAQAKSGYDREVVTTTW